VTDSLLKSLYACSVALFDARNVALTANRHDVLEQLSEAQKRVNLALSIAAPDLIAPEAQS
jgi:hypothetical protein